MAAGLAAAATPATDWPAYGCDTSNTRYSSLSQINTGNVTRLIQAGAFDTRPALGARGAGQA
jgi:glucose dehydrogenase